MRSEVAVPPVQEGWTRLYDQRRALRRAMWSTLTIRQEVALRLHEFDGLTYKEIGQRLGVSGAYAGQLVREAMQRLRVRARRLRDVIA